jgi:hypothetical protein
MRRSAAGRVRASWLGFGRGEPLQDAAGAILCWWNLTRLWVAVIRRHRWLPVPAFPPQSKYRDEFVAEIVELLRPS